jgi:hypothetical protein
MGTRLQIAIAVLLLAGCAPPSGPVAWMCAEADSEIATYKACAVNSYLCARKIEFAQERRRRGRCN